MDSQSERILKERAQLQELQKQVEAKKADIAARQKKLASMKDPLEMLKDMLHAGIGHVDPVETHPANPREDFEKAQQQNREFFQKQLQSERIEPESVPAPLPEVGQMGIIHYGKDFPKEPVIVLSKNSDGTVTVTPTRGKYGYHGAPETRRVSEKLFVA